MSTPKKKAGARSESGKKATDAGSQMKDALKTPVKKFKKETATSKAKR